MKHTYIPVTFSECHVYIESPVDRNECIVTIEAPPGLLLTLTDEHRDGKCVVEFLLQEHAPHSWKISLDDLRSLLNRAETLLVGHK
jgi:hypothetical protein